MRSHQASRFASARADASRSRSCIDITGDRVRLGLGRYPDVSLADVRKAATQHRGRIFNGADLVGEKATERAPDDNTVQALYEALSQAQGTLASENAECSDANRQPLRCSLEKRRDNFRETELLTRFLTTAVPDDCGPAT